jgi:hypothetical protein
VKENEEISAKNKEERKKAKSADYVLRDVV